MRYGLGRYGFDPAQPYFTSNTNSTRLSRRKTSHTVVVLQRSIASRTNGRERRVEWIAGKNIDASIAEIPAAGRRCHGQARAGYINLNTFSRAKSNTEKPWREKSVARVPRDEDYQTQGPRRPFTLPCQMENARTFQHNYENMRENKK